MFHYNTTMTVSIYINPFFSINSKLLGLLQLKFSINLMSNNFQIISNLLRFGYNLEGILGKISVKKDLIRSKYWKKYF